MNALTRYYNYILQHISPIFRAYKKRIIAAVIILVLLVLAGNIVQAMKPPIDFPPTAVVDVTDGMTVSTVSHLLQSEHIIRSPFWFTNFVLFFKGERQVVSGQYYFEKPLTVLTLARRMTKGDFHIDQLKTTIPEGAAVSDIAVILKNNYPNFDTAHFTSLAQGKEGYLFPDTYNFGADVSAERVFDRMSSTFTKRITDEKIALVIRNSGHSLNDLVIMASILEGEARQMQTRQIVAGILWKRITLGMPLQVDSTFKYINGKTTADLTLADLKIDSPYNTYIYRGLPPTPISNPGLDSIIAAATPITTDYLYFLTGDDGTMHYAATLEQHAANKKKYLK